MADIKPEENLRAYVDWKNFTCMNETAEHPLSSILCPNEKTPGGYLESSEDAQMIIDVSFNSAISLKKLKIYTDPSAEEQAPSRVFVFPHLEESMKDFTGLQELANAGNRQLKFWGRALTTEEVNGKFIDLSSVYRWYRNLYSIQIFVESNRTGNGDSKTRIDEIEFWGSVNDAPKSLAGLKQDDDE